MICATCKHDADQVVHCDCFSTFCHACFAEHSCGREHLARFTGGGDPEPVVQHQPADLSAAMLRLRPYQQECVDAILEALQ